MAHQTLEQWKSQNLSSDLLKAERELEEKNNNYNNLVTDYRRELNSNTRLVQENERLEQENENLKRENEMLRNMKEKYDGCYTDEEYQELANYTRKLEEMLKKAKAKLETK